MHHFKNSSSIASCHHDSEKNVLHITFNSGQTHMYHDCSKDIHDALIAADSPGKFFHANIRNAYKSEKVE